MPQVGLPGAVALAGALGVAVGAFLNVCIFRLPRNCLPILKLRFRCRHCPAPLPWWTYLPLVGRRIAGGACRSCGARFPWRLEAVELLTGALCAWAAWRLMAAEGPTFRGWMLWTVHAWFLSVLILSSAIDLEFGVLPDELTVAGMGQLALLSAALPELQPSTRLLHHPDPHVRGLLLSLAGAAVGAGFVYAVGAIGRRSAGREVVGLGVVKFAGLLGGMLGPGRVLAAIVTACAFGWAYATGLRLLWRRVGALETGPGLSCAALLCLYVPGWPLQALLDAARWAKAAGGLR
jgi:leader peptidase (prepilin peptidase)/N-methyltransferase